MLAEVLAVRLAFPVNGRGRYASAAVGLGWKEIVVRVP